MKAPTQSEDIIGFECAWPERALAGMRNPARPGLRWGRWFLLILAAGVIAYLGWRLGIAG